MEDIVSDLQELQRELRGFQSAVEGRPASASVSAQLVSVLTALESLHQAQQGQDDANREQAKRFDQALGGTTEILAQALDQLVHLARKIDQVDKRLAKIEANVAWMSQ